MEGNIKAIHGFSKITPLEQLNENFTLAECTVCGCGKNRNYSYISKDVIEDKLHTLSYLPIVANVFEKEDGSGYAIGGHDYDLVEENGSWKYKPLTQIVGCVIADSFEFKTIEEFGQDVEYLVCKCILYTEHVPELLEAAYSDDVYFSESMEIEVLQSRPLKDDSNYLEILDFNFLKLCLLGLSDDADYNTEPCFISSKVYDPTKFEFGKDDFTAMFENLKKQCPQYFVKEAEGGENVDKDNEITKPVEENAENVDEPVEAENVDVEVEVQTEEAPIEEPQDEASAENAEEADETEEAEEGGVEEDDEKKFSASRFSATYREKREALSAAIGAFDTVDINDEGYVVAEKCYWLEDFTDNEVYFSEESYNESSYSSKRYKAEYSMDSTDNAEISHEWKHVTCRWLTDDEIAKLEAEEREYVELKAFKENIEAQSHKDECDAVLEEFADIHEYDEFKELSDRAYEYEDTESLRKECFAIRGMHLTSDDIQRKNRVNVPIAHNENNTNADPVYAQNFFSKY